VTLVIDILARVARQTSVTAPSSWLPAIDETASDPTIQEVLDFLEETIEDVRDRVDAVGPMSKSVTITGTGAETYALPADLWRLHRTPLAVYEQQRTRRGCVPISDDGTWQYMKDLGSAGAYRYYRLQGYDGNYTISFMRPLETGVTVIVGYMSTVWIKRGGAEKSAFTAESDDCILPRRLVETGTIWRFRRRAGLDYADVQAQYEIEIAKLGNDTRGQRVVSFGDTATRAPWDIPIPDVIPPGP
jgi:hypothetical protein